jgi:ketosteroid isomerase-like protein
MPSRLVSSLAVATLLWAVPACADEPAVRSASQSLVAAWNSHDVKAWSAHLANDVWYTDIEDRYENFKGRDKAIGRFADTVKNSDLQWDIVRIKILLDGIVSVVLVQRMSILPKTAGKYQSVFTDDPAIARWRRDADGRWRVVFFTSHKGWALAEIKKDDEGRIVAAAQPPTTVASAPPQRAGSGGGEPAEYTAFWGRWSHGCNYCHGRPPGLPSSEIASRIVAIGAATTDGAGLRAAMQRKELGGPMTAVLADPALTDAALDAVRRYLVDVRDGGLPAQLAFEAPGATRELPLRNERSSRDAPVKITLLRVSGPFTVDAERSTCSIGAALAGQSACQVVLRAAPNARPGAAGMLELQLAPTKGLEPRLRRTTLRIRG